MSVWEGFDAAAARMLERAGDTVQSKKKAFSIFFKETSEDFSRMARIAARRRRPPPSWDLDDVKNRMGALAWECAFTHVSKDGTVGYDPARYHSPGRYIHFKIKNGIQKDLSAARGEEQHRRTGPGSPEYLSRTGELGGPGGLPDQGGDSDTEAKVDRSMRFENLSKLAETARDFVILAAISKGLGDDRTIIGFMTSHQDSSEMGFETPEKATRALDKFVQRWTKDLGAVPAKKKRTTKGELAA